MNEQQPIENPEEKDLNTEETLQNEEISAEEALLNEIAQLKTAVLRERADSENLRKRLERDAQNAAKFANERLIKDLIPVLDALTIGIETAKKQADGQASAFEDFITGSEMTLKLLLETLAKNGIEEINPVGEKLNPELHEALTVVPNPDLEPNTIIQVVQKGYVLHGRVVRSAQVIVSTK